MEKEYDEKFETQKQVVKLLKGKYSKRLLEQFEKSPEGKAFFEGHWPIAIVKNTYHLLTKTLAFEPDLTKNFTSFVNTFNVNAWKYETIDKWIKSIYPKSQMKTINVDNVFFNYAFIATYFTSNDETDLFYTEPLYIIIRRYISTPKIFKVIRAGEDVPYFVNSLNSGIGKIACTNKNCNFAINTYDNGQHWFNAETSQDVEDEKEQKTIAKGICPICGGKLIYYPSFTW